MGTASSRLLALFPAGWVLTDGAWGTELLARGVAPPLDLANIDRPGDVESVARSYVEAGSRVILTNTFRSNRIALEPFGKADLARTLNRRGVELSRSAAGAGIRVFGSIGPSGWTTGPDDLSMAFREQAETLAEAGVDALVCETFIDPNEAIAAIRAARSTGLPVIASFAFVGGLTPEAASKAANDAGADAIGANCIDISSAEELVRRLRAASGLPVWIKPNAGIPSVVGGALIYRDALDRFINALPTWIAAGADFVGGCCGTNPALIRALAMRRGRKGG